jgi:hypothetical protein
MNYSTAGDQLRHLERHGLLNHFGNTGLAGHGKTPKLYFLTRKGWEWLQRESDIPPELLGTHKEIKVEARWSPQTYHRLHTVDVLLALEAAVRKRPHLAIVKTFLEHRRVKRGNQIVRETTDYVDQEETSDNCIVPDAAFLLENRETKKRALFFLEMDMATESIVSLVLKDNRSTLHYKFAQYDRYLKSMQYRETYKAYGDFLFFVLLFVTMSRERVENVRREMQDLSPDLSSYYRFSTYEQAMDDFFGPIWKARAHTDTTSYPLVRESRTV